MIAGILPGLEARHSWIPPTTAAGLTLPGDLATPVAGALGLNFLSEDGSSADTGARLYPAYKLTRISGLHSLGESGDRRDNRVGAPGEIPRRSYRRGVTITYEGRVLAQSRDDLRLAEADLRTAFADQTAEGLMLVTPHPIYDGSGDFRYYPARALTLEIEDVIAYSPTRPTRGHESAFVIALRHSRAGGISYFDEAGQGFS